MNISVHVVVHVRVHVKFSSVGTGCSVGLAVCLSAGPFLLLMAAVFPALFVFFSTVSLALQATLKWPTLITLHFLCCLAKQMIKPIYDHTHTLKLSHMCGLPNRLSIQERKITMQLSIVLSRLHWEIELGLLLLRFCF